MDESIQKQLEAALQNRQRDLALQLLNDHPLTNEPRGTDFSGCLQIAVSTGYVDVCTSLIQQCDFSQAHIDQSLNDTNAILNQHETLALMLEQHPSIAVLNGILREYARAFIWERDVTSEDSRGYGRSDLIDPMRGIELLINAGAREEPFERDTLLAKMLAAGRQDLFDRYYDRAALRPILLLARRNRDVLIFEWTLTQSENFDQEEIHALLAGCLMDVKPNLRPDPKPEPKLEPKPELDASVLFDRFLPKLIDIDLAFQGQEHLIQSAVVYNKPDFVSKILDRGAKADLPGRSTLLLAVANKSLEISKLLLKAKADPNVEDGQAIITATQNDQIEMVQLLLRYNASASTKRNRAMKFARANNNPTMIEVLAAAGAKRISDEPYRFGLDLETATMGELWLAWLRYCQEFVLETDVPFVPAPTAELEATLALVESQTGLKIPEDLRVIYQSCNGGDELFFGLNLFSPAGMLSENHFWRDLSPDFVDKPENDQPSYPVFPEQTIKKQYINLHWLVFANDGTTNYLSIDFDPDTNGTSGQIINSGRDQWERFRCASSLLELTRKAIQRIEADLTENSADGYFYLVKNGQGILGDVLELVKSNTW